MIEIINKQKRFWINLRKFKDLFQKLVNLYNLKDPEISLVFVDTKTIKRLNLRYLHKNDATDVLSFPIKEKGADGRYYLGDIIISVPQAFRQSFSSSHGLERELELLAIHGFLHLLGFGHSSGIEEEEEKIRKAILE